MPPGTSRTAPVRSPAASESRNATRPATAAALANRRSATTSVSGARVPSGQIAVSSALTAAGTSALTRMPYRLVWLASARVNPATPALLPAVLFPAALLPAVLLPAVLLPAVLFPAVPLPAALLPAAEPYTPDTEDTATIRPERRFIMAGSTAWHRWNRPSRLVSVTARQSASSSWASGRSRLIPAQLTTASTGPRSSACLTQEVTSAASVRSAWTGRTRAPTSAAAFSAWTANCSSRE
jgi:hypothetical protein